MRCSEFYRADGGRAIFGASCFFPDSPWTKVTKEFLGIFQAQGADIVSFLRTGDLTKHDWREAVLNEKPYIETHNKLVRLVCYEAGYDYQNEAALDSCQSGSLQLLQDDK